MKCFEDNKEQLVKLINKQRDADGISVRALAKTADCSQSGLNQTLKKGFAASLDKLLLLLNALGFTVTLNIKHAATGKETNIRLRK